MIDSADQGADADASVVWQRLSDQIDAFINAWEKGGPPQLAAFLPAVSTSERLLTLVELIKVDLEYRWKDSQWHKTIEQYVQDFPELASEDGPPCDIIYEEFHIRRAAGEAILPSDYYARFPQRCEELRRLLPADGSHQTSTLAAKGSRVPVFEAGQRVDDFDLLSPIGKGAFATVFLARQKSMQRLVALKISRDRGAEPQTLAQLDHPHIVRVFDHRQLPDRKLRLLYMQYVAGGTLQGVIEHAKTVPPLNRSGRTFLAGIDSTLEQRGEATPNDSLTRYRLQKASWAEIVCWLGARLAGALAYAHARGVLHRDVKPANVLVASEGHPKLADFNISFSKLDGATPAAYFGGSLAYMSPEQLEACDPTHSRSPEELDGRSDIYSLGVMLWELLTLRRPFSEEALPDSWGKALGKLTEIRRKGILPQDLARIPPEAPPMVIEVLKKCLAPQPADRYRTADELARELNLCLQPRAQSLLHISSTTFLLKRYAVFATVAFGLIPNIVMSLLNIAYNWNAILYRLGPDERGIFLSQIMVVNGTAYTIGLGYICWSRGKLFVTLAKLARREKLDAPPGLDLVKRCLTLGTATAMITAALWTISGFVFPSWLYFVGGPTSELSSTHFWHFVVSNLLCGLIAATQSFYMVSFFAVRYCYPWLARARVADARETLDLTALARQARLFLVLTVSVPFLALLALVLINFDRTLIGVLCGIGLLGCDFAHWLDQAIRGDLAALASAMNPDGDALLLSDSMDSSLSDSRRY